MDTAYASSACRSGRRCSCSAPSSRCATSWAVADAGLKALGMDHGNPSIAAVGDVWFCSDEHITFGPRRPPQSATACASMPAHVDPTVADHEAMWVVDGDEVVDRWPSTCAAGDRVSASRRPAAGRGTRGRGGDGVLLGSGHLGERAAVALGRDEQRVVAEPAVAARLVGDRRPRHALGHDLRARRERGQRDGAEARRPRRAPIIAARAAACARCRRRCALAGVTGGVHAGRAVERVDLETGVVGDRRQPGGVARAPPP